MFKRIKSSNVAVNVLVDTEGIDTMAKLAKITSARASKLAKVVRSPGGTGAGTHVTKGAEHNLVIAAAVANDAIRVSRTIKCAEILAPSSFHFKRHEQQQLMEEEWGDKTAVSKFTLLTKKELKKGWKVHASKFCIAAAGVRGINDRAPLASLLRDQLIPTAEVDDDADDDPDLDLELIARHPIICKDHLVVVPLDLDKLEKGGPTKKGGQRQH